MAGQTLATLRVDGVPVARCDDGRDLGRELAPRPYLHPVRTLGGVAVSDATPEDHPWHLGVSVAVQDVGGWNFWGGPTFVRDEGYVWREDHGRIEHVGFAHAGDNGFTESLCWATSDGEVLLAEQRVASAGAAGRGWELGLRTTLTNSSDRPLWLGSPATNGRAGAGYGGLFWRLPPTGEPRVRTPAGEGEAAAHDSVAPWLAWADAGLGFTLVFVPVDRGTASDPWFVRVDDYPGVGSQIAARSPVALGPGDTLARGLRVLVADGVLDDGEVGTWAGGVAAAPPPPVPGPAR
jgi:hypothetical protein